jgi:hypothetical protein
MVRRSVSGERKAVFYVGMGLMGLGFLTFMSIFVTAALNFGNFDNFNGQASSFMIRAILGMGMMMAGTFCMVVGRMGLAGSGVVLDPERAREDVEPWSRMTGGVIKDVLDESGIDLGQRRREVDAEPDYTEKLRKLHALFQDGILTEEEYQREKAEILENN